MIRFIIRSIRNPNMLLPIWMAAIVFVHLVSAVYSFSYGDIYPNLPLAIFLLLVVTAYTAAFWGQMEFRHDPFDYCFILIVAIFLDSLLGSQTTISPSYVDALTNSAALMTTTAVSVVVDTDSLPPSYHLYRALLQSLGAIWMVQFTVVAVPARVFSSLGENSELAMEHNHIFLSKLNRVWFSLIGVFAGLMVLSSSGLWLFGLRPADAFFLSAALVSLGGLFNYDASLGYFDAAGPQLFSCLVMFAAATSWILHLRFAATRKLGTYVRSKELRFFALIVAAIIAISFLTLLYYKYRYEGSLSATSLFPLLLDVVVYCISTITTTGVASEDYQIFGPAFLGLTLIFGMLGGCSGTPSGGVKMARIMLQAKAIGLIFNGRRFARFGSMSISLNSLQYLQVFVLFFFLLMMVSVAVLTAMGLDLETSYSMTVLTLTNLGVGLGSIIGPSGNYSSLPDAAKIWSILLMIAGRVELGLVFVFASSRYWLSPETLGRER